MKPEQFARPAESHQVSDDEWTGAISRAAFGNIITGYMLGFISGAAAVLLVVSL